MIKFHLPDFYDMYHLNMAVINMLMSEKEKFVDDIEIGSLYGSFPGAYWNGGRVMHGITNKQNIIDTINNINIFNVPVRFTFTNEYINEHMLYDPYCNMIMKSADNGKNEVLVTHPLLEEYLRNTYPSFKFLSSTTKCITDIDNLNNELDKYHLTVMDYRKNSDKDFHKQIKNKKKVELLINAYCSPACDKRKQHYEHLSHCQIYNEAPKPFCSIKADSFWDSLEFDSVIKRDDLYDYYIKEGFENFKIEGRTLHPIDVIDSYVYYMVKPEYQNEIRNRLAKVALIPIVTQGM